MAAVCRHVRFTPDKRTSARHVLAMSALCHKRTSRRLYSITSSARPAASAVREAERLRRLEIDHHLELDGLLDGYVGRLCPVENLMDVGGRSPV